MTKDECKEITLEHINKVRENLNEMGDYLIVRGEIHDGSKLVEPELSGFTECTSKLAGLTYGSDEYKEQLKEMQQFLDHHYKSNRHHPEHFENGILGMNLMDLCEMFCDWAAATTRHADGDIYKSIEHNKERFGIPEELCQIFRNTAPFMYHCRGVKDDTDRK